MAPSDHVLQRMLVCGVLVTSGCGRSFHPPPLTESSRSETKTVAAHTPKEKFIKSALEKFFSRDNTLVDTSEFDGKELLVQMKGISRSELPKGVGTVSFRFVSREEFEALVHEKRGAPLSYLGVRLQTSALTDERTLEVGLTWVSEPTDRKAGLGGGVVCTYGEADVNGEPVVVLKEASQAD